MRRFNSGPRLQSKNELLALKRDWKPLKRVFPKIPPRLLGRLHAHQGEKGRSEQRDAPRLSQIVLCRWSGGCGRCRPLHAIEKASISAPRGAAEKPRFAAVFWKTLAD